MTGNRRDLVLIAGLIAFLIFVVIAKSGGVNWLAVILLTIPAPTEHWAEIIGHLAWPITIAWLVLRYRHSLRRLAEIIITRAKTDDMSIGKLFEFTQNSSAVPLSSKGDSQKGDPFYREQLLEFVRDANNIKALDSWLGSKGRQSLKIVELVTSIEYESLRESAYRDLIEGKGGGNG